MDLREIFLLDQIFPFFLLLYNINRTVRKAIYKVRGSLKIGSQKKEMGFIKEVAEAKIVLRSVAKYMLFN
jgi:hypothetical protein